MEVVPKGSNFIEKNQHHTTLVKHRYYTSSPRLLQ